jgi:hypothetical protein
MPPIPPPGIAGSFSGMSVIRASVVRIIAAMEEAFSNAERTTFAGSVIPLFSRST